MPYNRRVEILDRAIIDADHRIGELTSLICDMDRLGMITAGNKQSLQTLIDNQAVRRKKRSDLAIAAN
jgi:hypothetical protein